MKRLAFAVLPLAVALLGRHNPLDALVRGTWVHFWQTGTGEQTVTMCLPAQTPDELVGHRAELPDRVRAMHAAGATVVAIDWDLSVADPSDDALREAAKAGPTLFGREGEALAFAEPSGTTEMDHAWLLPLVLAARPAAEQPLGVAAFALHTGGPARIPHDDPVLFMPYRIPTLHWDDQADWHLAKGRVVTIGACHTDRELTRYGPQPGPVTHGEVVETLLAGRFPWEAPAGLDVLFAWLAFGAAYMARFRGGAALVGVLAVAGSLGASLFGWWLGLSGLALGALAGWWARD